MTNDRLLLDDLARVAGMTRAELDHALAGVESGLRVSGAGSAARFDDTVSFIDALAYLSALETGEPAASPESASLGELIRLASAVESMTVEGRARELEIAELRRILHRVVVDNVLLTERVAELSLLRLRPRPLTAAGGTPWYRRWLERLLGRGGEVRGASAGRRVA